MLNQPVWCLDHRRSCNYDRYFVWYKFDRFELFFAAAVAWDEIRIGLELKIWTSYLRCWVDLLGSYEWDRTIEMYISVHRSMGNQLLLGHLRLWQLIVRLQMIRLVWFFQGVLRPVKQWLSTDSSWTCYKAAVLKHKRIGLVCYTIL